MVADVGIRNIEALEQFKDLLRQFADNMPTVMSHIESHCAFLDDINNYKSTINRTTKMVQDKVLDTERYVNSLRPLRLVQSDWQRLELDVQHKKMESKACIMQAEQINTTLSQIQYLGEELSTKNRTVSQQIQNFCQRANKILSEAIGLTDKYKEL